MSLKPTTDTSSGQRLPDRRSVSIAPRAIRSLPATTAVTTWVLRATPPSPGRRSRGRTAHTRPSDRSRQGRQSWRSSLKARARSMPVDMSCGPARCPMWRCPNWRRCENASVMPLASSGTTAAIAGVSSVREMPTMGVFAAEQLFQQRMRFVGQSRRADHRRGAPGARRRRRPPSRSRCRYRRAAPCGRSSRRASSIPRTIGGKIGLVRSGINTPTDLVLAVRSALAIAFGEYPMAAAAATTRRTVLALSRSRVAGLSARDAVAVCTPARRATSARVGALFTELATDCTRGRRWLDCAGGCPHHVVCAG